MTTLPTITIGDLSKAEGNTGTSNAVLTLTLSASSATAVTVAYATADGTATAGTDYTHHVGNADLRAWRHVEDDPGPGHRRHLSTSRTRRSS